jgi:hypothetical protein
MEEAGAKATSQHRKGGATWARVKSPVGDPNPVDLVLGRSKPSESWVEDRTGSDVQIVRLTWD